MHEYAMTQGLVEAVVRAAEQAGAAKVTTIRLAIGDRSGATGESIRMYFDLLSRDSLAEGAQLAFRRIPAELLCRHCGAAFTKPARGFACPTCGEPGAPTNAGRECYIESIEVET